MTSTDSPLLDDCIFVDTPGILAGEKQISGRDYDFVDVMRWYYCVPPVASPLAPTPATSTNREGGSVGATCFLNMGY